MYRELACEVSIPEKTRQLLPQHIVIVTRCSENRVLEVFKTSLHRATHGFSSRYSIPENCINSRLKTAALPVDMV
jgi:hypothetical protein